MEEEAAWLADFSDWGKVVITGPDRKKFLHGLLTNDILALKPGGHCSACLLTPKGMLLADMELYDRGEDILALVQRKAMPNLLAALSKRIILSDAAMQDVSSESLFYVFGPETQEIVSKAGCSGLQLPYPKLCPKGVLALGPAALRRTLIEAGAAPVGPERIEEMRIERGVPLFGVDMGTDTIPLEARLEDSISFTKGCYMGQETITRIKDRGHVNKILVRLRIDGRDLPEPGSPVTAGDAPIGKLTSAAWSAKAQAVLGLGTIAVAYAKAQTKVNVAARPAEVLA